MKIKNMVVIGMPRGGTTYLYHNLQRHPQIFMPFRKEVNYFNVNFDRGPAWYNNLYSEASPDQVRADISPPCFMEPLSDSRILEFNPDTKVILSVRDPLEWALSFYAQFASFNYDMVPFSEFVDGYNYKVLDKVLHIKFKDNFVPERIHQLQERFGNNLLIYNQRILHRDSLRLFRVLEKFLEVETYFDEHNIDDRKINASGRINMIWLSKLLSREAVINSIEKTIPRKLVLLVRRFFDSGSAKKNTETIFEHSTADRLLAQELFSDQQKWVDTLFSKGDFLLGKIPAFPDTDSAAELG